ncbi:MAG: YjjW family glycine radical enzyme activase [bacterium]|nr:YjjW family glycine radical enzyme activase [bacterium]
MVKGRVGRIIPFSAVDGPGNRTVIFLQGCGFRCLYCHNPETINMCNHCGLCAEKCPTGALRFHDKKVSRDPDKCSDCDTCIGACPHFASPKIEMKTVDECFFEIHRARAFASGITVTGGECTQQYEFLTLLLKRARQENISAFIDTNGDLPVEKMAELSKIFDKAMLDIKCFDDTAHCRLTGKPVVPVLENARFLLQAKKLHQIRTVIVPEVLNNSRNVDKISRLIAGTDPSVIYKLIKFRRVGVKKGVNFKEPLDREMRELKELAQKNGCRQVKII